MRGGRLSRRSCRGMGGQRHLAEIRQDHQRATDPNHDTDKSRINAAGSTRLCAGLSLESRHLA